MWIFCCCHRCPQKWSCFVFEDIDFKLGTLMYYGYIVWNNISPKIDIFWFIGHLREKKSKFSYFFSHSSIFFKCWEFFFWRYQNETWYISIFWFIDTFMKKIWTLLFSHLNIFVNLIFQVFNKLIENLIYMCIMSF